jgi:hypothetical protein
MSNYKGDDRFEKHYTPKELLDHMWAIKDQFVDFEVTEWLENSAGAGYILDYIKERSDKPTLAFDIMNETKREDIKECNYLKEKVPYKNGRVCIMNPPFQNGLKFLSKAVEECDYVISILSLNSLLNLDYSKIWVDEILMFRKYDFITCKASIIIVGCRKKTENDKYEYEQ